MLCIPRLKRIQYYLNDFLNGSNMWKFYKECRHIMEAPSLSSERARQKYLLEIIDYAKSNTKFYGQFYDAKKLTDFPVINKQTILNHYSDFLVDPKLIPGQKGDIHVARTSGSTGTHFEIRQDTLCRARRIATIKAANEKYNFHSFEPMMHLRNFEQYWNWAKENGIRYNKKLNIVYADNSNLTGQKIKDIIDAMNKYKVKLVRGYMTSIDIITRYSIENNYPITCNPIFISVGEILLDSVRERIVNMGFSIVSQYGNEENGILGDSFINSAGTDIILNRCNCFIEILKLYEDVPARIGELGRVVITDFTNHAMPMIRYDIGDLAAINAISPSPYNSIISISKLSGRKQDLIFRPDGTQIDILNSLPNCIIHNPDIKQWQFTQHSEKSYSLKLSSATSTIPSQVPYYKEQLKEILGKDAEITISFSDELPILSSGKRRIVISEYLRPSK